MACPLGLKFAAQRDDGQVGSHLNEGVDDIVILFFDMGAQRVGLHLRDGHRRIAFQAAKFRDFKPAVLKVPRHIHIRNWKIRQYDRYPLGPRGVQRSSQANEPADTLTPQ